MDENKGENENENEIKCRKLSELVTLALVTSFPYFENLGPKNNWIELGSFVAQIDQNSIFIFLFIIMLSCSSPLYCTELRNLNYKHIERDDIEKDPFSFQK